MVRAFPRLGSVARVEFRDHLRRYPLPLHHGVPITGLDNTLDLGESVQPRWGNAWASFGDELELGRRRVRRRGWLSVKDRLARLTSQNLHRTILQPLEGVGDRREL